MKLALALALPRAARSDGSVAQALPQGTSAARPAAATQASARRFHPSSGHGDSSVARIISRQPAHIGFRVHDYEHTDERALRADTDDDACDDNDDDDDADVPRFDSPGFAVNFDIADAGYDDNICVSGCEGEYEEIHDAMESLWDDHREEYELFFLAQGRYAVAVGVIYDDFSTRVEALRRDHPAVDTLVMVNVPGSANDDALVVGARLVHQYGYRTCIPSDGLVASGGTDMFVSGVERYATPGATVGIHSWENGDGSCGNDFPRDHPEHQMYLELYEDICIPQEFYWETLKSGLPMHDITESEMVGRFPYMRDCTPESNTGKACGPADVFAIFAPFTFLLLLFL